MKEKFKEIEAKLKTSSAEHRYQELKKIVDSGSMRKVDGMTVDLTTANMVVQIADKLKHENRHKFLSLPMQKMISVGWKLIK